VDNPLGRLCSRRGIAAAQAKKVAKSDAEIRQEIIKQSIASYRGICPSPYDVDRVGRTCGRAYSRPGDASSVTKKDVTLKMVDEDERVSR